MRVDARTFRAGGVRCEVLAPSKLHRPVGERAKTDARDALHIAKLLRRGIAYLGKSTWTAFGLAVEIGDWSRLDGRRIGSYLGLVPTEGSSGTSRSQGGLTRTGKAHARRLLMEAEWHHRAASTSTSLAGAGRWRRWRCDADRVTLTPFWRVANSSVLGVMREHAMSNHRLVVTLDSRSRHALRRKNRPAVPNPRISD
jgi:transposase